jgi:hypothetical protein
VFVRLCEMSWVGREVRVCGQGAFACVRVYVCVCVCVCVRQHLCAFVCAHALAGAWQGQEASNAAGSCEFLRKTKL